MAAIVLILLASITLFAIIYTENQSNKPVFVEADTGRSITNITLVTLNFNNTNHVFDQNSIETSIVSPARDFIIQSSGNRADIAISSRVSFVTDFNESYYGQNNSPFADVNLQRLHDEIENITVGNPILVLHAGIAEQLVIGNDTGLIDQYLSPKTGFSSRMIILSQSSPWSVLVHELGHHWGLPDLFQDRSIGRFGMMGTGLWNADNGGYDGTEPADFSPWSKDKLGWLSYWDASNSSKSDFDLNTTVKFERVYITYLDKGIDGTKPGLLVQEDLIARSYLWTENLMQAGDSLKFDLYYSGTIVLIQFKDNEIKISKPFFDNLFASIDFINDLTKLIFAIVLITSGLRIASRRD